MNCKQGDLAIVVRTTPIGVSKSTGYRIVDEICQMLLGRIIRCKCLWSKDIQGNLSYTLVGRPAWELEEPITVKVGDAPFMVHAILDECLKPLPPLSPEGDTETETLKEFEHASS